MALKRCVTIRAPAANAVAAPAAPVSLCPKLTTAPAARQRRDLPRRDALWRHRNDQHRQPARRVAEKREVRLLHRPDQPRVMRPLAPGIEMRPLEVQPEKPRHPVRRRRDARLHRRAGDLRRIRDQRRQEPGRPQQPVRRTDRPDPVQIRPAVQHHPAAAVHLQVDEPRRQHPPVQPNPLARRRLVRRHDRRHPPVLDHQRRPGVQPRPVEDRGSLEDRGGHTVSVTLRR